MDEAKVLLTAGTGAGLFLWFFIWLIKFLFKEITKRERWIIFGLLYAPITFCLIYVTMNGDGKGINGKGKQAPETQQVLQPKSSKNAFNNPLNLFISSAYAKEIIHPEIAKIDFCGVVPKEYIIYLSFNDDKPYYINPGSTTLRLVLKDLDHEKQIATVEINDNGNPLSKTSGIITQPLSLNNAFDFNYKECKFRITYLGYDSFNAGFFYLFRTRYIAKIRIDKV